MASVYENILMACLDNKTASSGKLTESSKSMGLLEGEDVAVSNETKALAEEDETVLFAENEVDLQDSELGDTFEDEIAGLDAESDDEDDDDDEIAELDNEDTALLVTAVTTDDITDEEAIRLDADDFVDNFVYRCACCGKVVLSPVALDDGNACPSCGEINVDDDNNESHLEVIGKIAPIEDETEDVEEETVEDADDIVEDETTEETVEDAEEETVEDTDVDDSDIVDVTEKTEESFRHSKYNVKERKNTMNNVSRNRSLMLDESTFNPFLKKFVTENYENATSFRVVGAKKSGSKLTLECKLSFKSGNSKSVKLVSENFKPVSGKFTFTATENSAFKIEKTTRKSPFIFTATMRNGVVRCEGLKYNYNTVIGEKKYKVYGSLIKESRSR